MTPAPPRCSTWGSSSPLLPSSKCFAGLLSFSPVRLQRRRASPASVPLSPFTVVPFFSVFFSCKLSRGRGHLSHLSSAPFEILSLPSFLSSPLPLNTTRFVAPCLPCVSFPLPRRPPQHSAPRPLPPPPPVGGHDPHCRWRMRLRGACVCACVRAPQRILTRPTPTAAFCTNAASALCSL